MLIMVINWFFLDFLCSVTCILKWASCKKEPSCPQCKNRFEFLDVHRALDGRYVSTSLFSCNNVLRTCLSVLVREREMSNFDFQS